MTYLTKRTKNTPVLNREADTETATRTEQMGKAQLWPRNGPTEKMVAAERTGPAERIEPAERTVAEENMEQARKMEPTTADKMV